jgi:hypothetical protein
MAFTQEEKNAYKSMMVDLQNLLFYTDVAWREKHGSSMLKEKAMATDTGFQFQAVNDLIEKELEIAEEIYSTTTEEEKAPLDPKRFEKIPKEMRDLMDSMVRNMSSFKDQHHKDTVWLASVANETITEDRLVYAQERGYHNTDFKRVWETIEQKKKRRCMLEFKNA